MKRRTPQYVSLLLGILISLTACVGAQAGDDIELAGDIMQYTLPAAAVIMILENKDSQGALQFGESAALTVGITEGLKYAVDERRPNGGKHSFPSAHTSISFSAAEFIRKRYGWEYGIPAYAAASFVAYSRVEARQHHPQDVVAGAAIGIINSYLFTRPYKGWQVQAETDGKYYGIRLTLNW